jgi:hypothetical protein
MPAMAVQRCNFCSWSAAFYALGARAVVCARQPQFSQFCWLAQALLKACVMFHQQGGTCLLPADAEGLSLLTLIEGFILLFFGKAQS